MEAAKCLKSVCQNFNETRLEALRSHFPVAGDGAVGARLTLLPAAQAEGLKELPLRCP